MAPVIPAYGLVAIGAICLAFGGVNPSPTIAEESGFITIDLADEQLDLPMSAGHSDWTGSQNFAEVSIFARPSDVVTWQRFQSLRLTFDLLRSGAQTPEMSVLRRKDDAGFERLFGRSDLGGLRVSITERSFDEDQLFVGGTFAGTLGQSTDFGRTINFAAPVPVSGTFAATLNPIR